MRHAGLIRSGSQQVRRYHAQSVGCDVNVFRAKFDELAAELQIKALDEWYKFGYRDIVKRGASGILRRYGESISSCLGHLYPEHDWELWQFKVVPMKHWFSHSNQREKLDQTAKALRVKSLDDWYSVSTKMAIQNGAWGVLSSHGGSLATSLAFVYPSFEWEQYRFVNAPQRYWNNIENQRSALNALEKELDIKTFEGWYNVQAKDIPLSLFRYYGSVSKLLEALRPTISWDTKRFVTRTPINFWTSEENQKSFLKRARDALSISSPEQWYRVSQTQLKALGGQGLKKYWPYALKLVDPHFVWDWGQFVLCGKASNQRILVCCIRSLFTDSTVLEEHVIDTTIASRKGLYVDVYVPEYNLAFEYQGEQHYRDFIFKGHYTSQQCIRDSEKLQICKESGICLIVVPYWWDGNINSLKATINTYHPHLRFPIPYDASALSEQEDNTESNSIGLMGPVSY